VKKIGNFSYPLLSDAPFRGFRQNIGTPFGMGKLVWCRYPMVKKFEDIFIRFGATHERDGLTDGRTDRHRVTAYTALMHMHRAVKIWHDLHCFPNQLRLWLGPAKHPVYYYY